jgi:hypothetical protein
MAPREKVFRASMGIKEFMGRISDGQKKDAYGAFKTKIDFLLGNMTQQQQQIFRDAQKF